MRDRAATAITLVEKRGLSRATRGWLMTAGIAAAVAFFFLAGRPLVCGLADEREWCRWWPQLPLERLDDVIRGLGPWGPAAAIGLMILHSLVPFPAELLSLANGAVFGVLPGIAITWTGAMLGAFLAFGLARTFGRPLVLKLLNAKQERQLESWVERLGTDALLLGRFIPLISFNLMNYAAGLAPVSWWTFAWTTGLGILPLTVLMTVMGDRFALDSWRFWLLALAAALVVWLPAHLLLKARRATGAGPGRGGD